MLAILIGPVLPAQASNPADHLGYPELIGQLLRYEGTQYGVASWYGPGFDKRKTASGERFSQYSATAAHRHLPLGTTVLVTNLKNGRSTMVRINDRGPYVHGRVIDLSLWAALQLAMKHDGLTPVRIQVVD